MASNKNCWKDNNQLIDTVSFRIAKSFLGTSMCLLFFKYASLNVYHFPKDMH